MGRFLLAWLSLFLFACGPSARAPHEEDIDHLERDLGGPEVLSDLLHSHDADELSALFADYGIGFVSQAVSADCPQRFLAVDRSTWFQIGGEFYYVDAYGRPSRAYADLPPIATEARMTACQTAVGQWGDAEDPSQDFDGGHLIGSQLGGHGGRENLVPQNANFNRGNWVAIENRMARCRALPNRRLRYYVTVSYASTTKLVPATFRLDLSNAVTSARASFSFQNAASGGTSGATEKDRAIAFLAAEGCD